ncbi:MAG TPA: pilus assembly protein TadG-related protein [Vicinamibacterales bacterium]|nr:pilus assembly protein TadG-related protein [Vicinamibacterales bacterium]
MQAFRTRLHRDERGMSFVFVGASFMAFMAATTIAIDVGMFMTARSQAQNAADAGALAGAIALAFDDPDDKSSSGPAVQNAITAARLNRVINDEVAVDPSDVTFPVGPNGEPRVRVNVFRTAARGNPVATLIGQAFGVFEVDIAATATAEASRANAMTCVKPFTIPDRWAENTDPPWTPDSRFQYYDKKGNRLANPDVYIGPQDKANYTGYDAHRDKGMRLMIRAGTGNNIQPSFYYSYAMGGETGGSDYRWNIENCNTTVMGFGEDLLMEPGNMVGPTNQGIDALIAKDPLAYWDDFNNKVVSTMNPSPRVSIIPVYDPMHYETGKVNGRTADLRVANYVGFFIEYRSGNNVYGRITPVSGIYSGSAGPAPAAAFPVVIRLVE